MVRKPSNRNSSLSPDKSLSSILANGAKGNLAEDSDTVNKSQSRILVKILTACRPSMVTLLLALTIAWPLGSANGGILPSFLTPKLKSTNGMMHLTAKFDTTPRDASAIVWSPDSQHVISTGIFSDTVNIFDIPTKKQVKVLQRQAGGSATLAISPDGRYIASDGGRDKFNTDRQKNRLKVLVWDARTGTLIHQLSSPFTNPGGDGVTALAFSPDSRTLAVGYHGMAGYISDEINYLYLYDMNSGALIKSFGNVKTGAISILAPIVYSPDGKYLADGSSDGDIRIWDVGSGKLDKTIKAHSYYVKSIAYSPDGKWIVSGTVTGTIIGKLNKATGEFVKRKITDPIRIWDASSGKLIATLDGYVGTVATLAFSRDGKYFASGTYDKTIRIWDTVSWQLLDSLTLEYFPMSVGFSPDGNYLAAGAGYIVHVFEFGKH
jgi:WD40 repeat protein